MKGRRPRLPELAALYLLIGLLLVVRRKRHFFLLVTLSLIIVAGDAAYWYGQKWHRNDLRVTYLSVGYGDAAVVEFPGSKVLLIDAGGSSPQGWDSGRSIIAPFLRSRRIKKVDYVLVTHPRVDHYGEMKSILEEVLPSEFWSSSLQAKTGRYRELEKTADGLGIERIVLRRNDGCRRVGEVRLCISYPLGENPLETSVVLRLTLGQYHFLFPGDIKKGDEQKLANLGTEMSSHVLKVPRHGSYSSSSEVFVQAVKPKLAIFSVGGRNRFGLTRPEVVSRYLDSGSVILRSD